MQIKSLIPAKPLQIPNNLSIKKIGLLDVYHVAAVWHNAQNCWFVVFYKLRDAGQKHVVFAAHNVQCWDAAVVNSEKFEQRIYFSNKRKPAFKLFLVEFFGFVYK